MLSQPRTLMLVQKTVLSGHAVSFFLSKSGCVADGILNQVEYGLYHQQFYY